MKSVSFFLFYDLGSTGLYLNFRDFFCFLSWEGYKFTKEHFPFKKATGHRSKQPCEAHINITYVPHNTEEIRHAYKSKHNLKFKNQVILLMIAGGENDIILL